MYKLNEQSHNMNKLDENLSESLNISKQGVTTPVIFNKKKNKTVYKPLQHVTNDIGITRHQPPAAQEWFNSVYNYNKNQIKTLPILDKNLMNLLKSYFNMQVNHKILNIKRRVSRFRRISHTKIFVGKGELKHTNSKVIITLYVYNVEKKYLITQLKKQFKSLYLARFPLVVNHSLGKYNEIITSYNRPFTLEEFLNSPTESKVRFKRYPLKIVKDILTYREIYISTVESAVKKLTSCLTIINEYYIYLSMLVQEKVLNQSDKYKIFANKIPNFDHLFSYPNFEDKYNLAYLTYKKKLVRYLYLLKVNIAKSEPNLLVKLAYIVKNMYNKEVEFNVVELNKMHLNTDIFTQTIALKLKNRKNGLFNVLKSSLSKVDLPNVSRRSERYYEFNRDDLLVNKIRNSYISSMIDTSHKTDNLNDLLLDLFTLSDDLEIQSKYNLPVSLETYVLKSLKHLKLAGVRVEAKGRLTKRFTASKSVFKMRWKGGLKNVDSSFKGIPAVMLRGIVKSNVQYSFLSSKNRIGAYGVKGWIGNK